VGDGGDELRLPPLQLLLLGVDNARQIERGKANPRGGEERNMIVIEGVRLAAEHAA